MYPGVLVYFIFSSSIRPKKKGNAAVRFVECIRRESRKYFVNSWPRLYVDQCYSIEFIDDICSKLRVVKHFNIRVSFHARRTNVSIVRMLRGSYIVGDLCPLCPYTCIGSSCPASSRISWLPGPLKGLRNVSSGVESTNNSELRSMKRFFVTKRDLSMQLET